MSFSFSKISIFSVPFIYDAHRPLPVPPGAPIALLRHLAGHRRPLHRQPLGHPLLGHLQAVQHEVPDHRGVRALNTAVLYRMVRPQRLQQVPVRPPGGMMCRRTQRTDDMSDIVNLEYPCESRQSLTILLTSTFDINLESVVYSLSHPGSTVAVAVISASMGDIISLSSSLHLQRSFATPYRLSPDPRYLTSRKPPFKRRSISSIESLRSPGDFSRMI